MRKEELLERLAEELGYDYISDLHVIHTFDDILDILDKISPEEYSLAEWNSAVQYLLGADTVFQTREEAKWFLTESLRKKGQNSI